MPIKKKVTADRTVANPNIRRLVLFDVPDGRRCVWVRRSPSQHRYRPRQEIKPAALNLIKALP